MNNNQFEITNGEALARGKKMIERPFKLLMTVSALIIAGLFALRFVAGLVNLSNILIPAYGVIVLLYNQFSKTNGSQKWQKWILLNAEDLSTMEREGIRRNWLTEKGLKHPTALKKMNQEDRMIAERRLAHLNSKEHDWRDISEIPWEIDYFVEQRQVKKEIQNLALMILAPVAMYGFLWLSVAGYTMVKVTLGVVCLLYAVNFLGKIFHYRTLYNCDEPMLRANSEEIKFYDGKNALHLPWKNLESVLLQGQDLKVIYHDEYLESIKHKKDKTEHLDLKFLYIPNQESFENLLNFYQQRFIKYRKGQDTAAFEVMA